MASLSEIIGRVIEVSERPGVGIDTHAAVETAFPMIMADPEAVEMCVRENAARRIKEAATRHKRRFELEDIDDSPDLFGKLRPRYALDIEGRVLKRTADLSQLELRRLITIRRDQIKADGEHLKLLEQVDTALEPIWDSSPSLTLGQAMNALQTSGIAAE